MNKIPQALTALVFLILLTFPSFSQNVKKSSIIEEIGARKFYIHLVQADEKIEQIAELYEVDVQEIYRSTPGLIAGQELKSNHILRIPVKDESLMDKHGIDSINDSYTRAIRTRKPEERGNIRVSQGKSVNDNKPTKRFEYHEVQAGETLYSLSKRYQVSIESIKRVNPGMQKEIRTGQTLMIPVYLSENVSEEKADDQNLFRGTKFSYYNVRPKETIYSITKNFGITQDDLYRMNPDLQTSELKAGSKIRIPHESSDDATTGVQENTNSIQNPYNRNMEDSINTVKYYKVGFLERLPGIAKRKDVTLEEIYRLNPGVRESGVKWGDVIKLPRKALVIEQIEEDEDTIDYIAHQVSKNETLYSIAKLYNLPQEDIIALNPGAGRVVKRGQVLKIPVKRQGQAEDVTGEKPVEEQVADIPKEEKEADCSKRMGSLDVYKVALMIPFHLESYQPLNTAALKDAKPNIKALNFIQFYEGAMLAIDTLRKQGMNAEVYIYDVGKTREDALQKMDKELSEVDLIIGPVYHEAFRTVSEFARQQNIKIVNPLSTRRDILSGSEGVFKIQASRHAELEEMASFISKRYSDTTSIFIVRDNQYQEEESLQFLQQKFRENGVGSDDRLKVFEVVYYSDSLHPVLDSTKWGNKNLVIGLSDKEVFTIEFVRHVNEMHDSIPNVTMFGLSEWRDFNLELAHLVNLDVHLFDDEFIDFDRRDVRWFIKKYRDWYATEPLQDKYAFEGFDITYYFLSALFNYGRDYQDCLKYYHPDLLQYHLYFEKNEWGSYENTKVIPLSYDRYKLQKISISPIFQREYDQLGR